MDTKINLKHKLEEKELMGVKLYVSDKRALEVLANSLGLTTSVLMRSVINDLLEGNIVVKI